MIVFFSDWKRYPYARPDFSTKNKSFIKMANLYKKQGVKNHAWPLALMDPSLKGIDPHSDGLSDLMKDKINYECKRNPIYYLREVARAPALSGVKERPVTANRGIMALWWGFFASISIILLIMIRQSGKSFSIDQLMVYLLSIRLTDTDINLLTRNDRLRTKNMRRLREIESGLPPYMQLQTAKDSKNTHEYTCRLLNNALQTYLPAASRKDAAELGRGFTSSINIIDEGPFLSNIDLTIPSMLPSGVAARDAARSVGDPHGTIFVTTAGSRDTVAGAYMHDMFQTAAEWSEHYFDADDREALEKIVRNNAHSDRESNSKRGVYRVSCVFNHRQLGYTDEWLRNAIEDSITTGAQKLMDFYNAWFSGSEASPLDKSVLERIHKSKTEPLFTELVGEEAYMLRWYLEEEDIDKRMKRNTVLSIDTSEAIGKDDIAAVLRDVITGERLAYAKINYTNTIKFSEFVFQLLVRFPEMVAIIERKSTGPGIMDNLLILMERAGMNPFRRLFNLVVHKGNAESKAYSTLTSSHGFGASSALAEQHHGSFGFSTSGSGEFSRKGLYSETLVANYKHTGHLVCAPILVAQVMGLEIRNNRVDHRSGSHDDFVIADLLGYWFLTKAKNLEYYGIDSKTVLSAIPIRDDMIKTPREARKKVIVETLGTDIALLEKALKKLPAGTPIAIRLRMERKLSMLKRKLGQEAIEFSENKEVHRIEQTEERKIRSKKKQNPWYLQTF